MSWAPQTEAFRRVVLPRGAAPGLVPHRHAGRLLGRAARCAARTLRNRATCSSCPHGDAYYLADPAGTEAAYDADEAVAFLRSMAAGEMPSIVSEGGAGGGGGTQFICGFLGCDLRPCNPVLDALPAMVHLRGANRSSDRMRHLIEFALCELREPSSGGRARAAAAGRTDVRRGRAAPPGNGRRRAGAAGWPACTIRWSRARWRCCTAHRPHAGPWTGSRRRPAPHGRCWPSVLRTSSASRRCST